MKKVLITGASGFIGRACLKPLEEAGFEIHAISTAKNHSDNKMLTWHQLDLHDFTAVRELLNQLHPDTLLHIAWYVEHGVYWSSQENLKWVASSLNLAQEFIANGGRRLIGTGTCAEYDWNDNSCSTPLLEDETPINPSTLYGACKASLHDTLLSMSKNAGISFTWGRLFFPYGYYENRKRLIPSIVLSLLQNKPTVCNNTELERDFIFVDDVGSIFAKLVSSSLEGTLNIGSGQGTKLGKIVNTIAKLLSAENMVEYKINPTTDPPILIANIDKLKNELKYTAQVSLEEGLIKSVDWWKKEFQKSNY